MNRSKYFDYIQEKLIVHASTIDQRGKLNVLDLHVHSENFYRDFFNLLFNWELENLNRMKHNVEGIDLIDTSNKLVVQVSATNTKQKVDAALSKDILKKYSGYRFKFISISKGVDDLRNKSFSNPHNISFSPPDDIYDNAIILKTILSMNIDALELVYNLIKKELGREVDIKKLDSNLATIIDILSKEDWDNSDPSFQIDYFEIDRKISHNNLNASRGIIDDYKIHYSRVDKKYAEFDAMGKNKSRSVLASIRREYIKAKKIENDDDLFFMVIEKTTEKIQNSANFVPIPIDELEICVDILIVDAFIRCKIFKDPENYHYAATR